MFNIPRNVWALVVAQAFGSCGTIMVIFAGSIVGAMIAPAEDLTTAPVTAVILGVAVSTVPAALLMRRIGRRAGFIIGCLIAATGALVGAYGAYTQNFWLFTAAMIPIGTNQAFIQQYRFAAVESVSSDRASRAIATVLLASIVAAILGPEVAVRARDAVADTPYVGSFIGLAALYLMSIAALTQLRITAMSEARNEGTHRRPLHQILLHPKALTAVAGAAIGYGVMTLLMTATPISMHIHRGMSEVDTKLVIQAHVLAMFLPSLVTGRMVARYGETAMLVLGIALNITCVGTAIAGDTFWHFCVALAALGVGWNLLFVASTTLLTRCYERDERYHVQAANDFSVFGFQATASFGAGLLVNLIGWENLAAVALIPLTLLGLLIVVYRVNEKRALTGAS